MWEVNFFILINFFFIGKSCFHSKFLIIKVSENWYTVLINPALYDTIQKPDIKLQKWPILRGGGLIQFPRVWLIIRYSKSQSVKNAKHKVQIFTEVYRWKVNAYSIKRTQSTEQQNKIYCTLTKICHKTFCINDKML